MILLPLLLSACTRTSSVGPLREPEPPAARPIPRPTGNLLDEGAEQRSHAGRAAWIEELHRHPPGVDWRGVEARNGLDQMKKRAALTRVGQGAGSRWAERGSWNQAGSMHITRPSSDGTLLYAGSDLGGIWKGSLDGGDWEPVGDNLYGGAQWLELIPATVGGGDEGDPDVIVAGTDSDSVNSITGDVAAGINWSRDDGATWSASRFPDGVGFTSTLRLTQSSDGSHTLYLLAGGATGYSMYRSTDGGGTFVPVHDLAHAGDLWVPRTGPITEGDPNPVYLLDGDQLSVSMDEGETWTDLASTGSGHHQGQLVGSEAGAPTLWSVQYDSRSQIQLFRSDDGGGSWTELEGISDYYGALNASTTDAGLVAYGGVELWKSDDGGEGFDRQNSWEDYYGNPGKYLHADIMGIDVVPDDAGGEAWYLNSHGGVYVSTNALRRVSNLSLSGMRVSQYYSTLTSVANPDHVMAGAQDQGIQATNTQDNTGDALDFEQLLSGDYGHLTSGDHTHRRVFSVYPGYVLVYDGEDDPGFAGYVELPEGESYSWIPTILADPSAPDDFWLCASKLYRYVYTSGVWTGAVATDQDFGRGYLSALASSPLDPDHMWAATSLGAVFASTDHGLTWTRGTGTTTTESMYYGSALVASGVDPNTVYVAGSAYQGSVVYRSTDGGATFEPWGEGLPATTAYALAESRDGTVFVGTETAAYSRAPGDAAWVDITGNEAPITIYWSAEALPGEDTIRFGTYGRGIWDYRISDGPGVCEGQDGDSDGVACTTDCDDGDASRHPGAAEVCGNLIDDDCDGNDPPCAPKLPSGKGCGCAGAGAGEPSWVGMVALALVAGLGRRGRQAGRGVWREPPTRIG